MKVNVLLPVLDYKGEAIKEGQAIIDGNLILQIKNPSLTKDQIVKFLEDSVAKDDLTYRALIHSCLNTVIKDEVLTPTDKSKAYEITTKLYATSEPNFTDNQVEFILHRADKVLTFPLHNGRLKDFLTEKEEPKQNV